MPVVPRHLAVVAHVSGEKEVLRRGEGPVARHNLGDGGALCTARGRGVEKAEDDVLGLLQAGVAIVFGWGETGDKNLEVRVGISKKKIKSGQRGVDIPRRWKRETLWRVWGCVTCIVDMCWLECLAGADPHSQDVAGRDGSREC